MRYFFEIPVTRSFFAAVLSFFAFLICTGASGETEMAHGSMPTRWLRADSGLSHMRGNLDLSLIAFVPVGERGIRIIETKSGKVFEASQEFTGGSFFWSPDRARLFFRELKKKGKNVESVVKAWDFAQKKSIDVESIDGPSGMLSFDPRDYRVTLMHNKGIMTKRLVFPDERLAQWQSAQRTEKGKWVAASGGMAFVTQQGFAMSRLSDDGSGIDSFDISPTGNLAAWATKSGKVFASRQGEAPRFIGFGKDPKWHPSREMIVYSGAHMIGTKVSSYDVKISEFDGASSFFTSTQDRNERWPIWSVTGDAVIYTISGTTDVFKLDLPKGFAL